MISEKEIIDYIDSIGIYTKAEKEALYKRYLSCSQKYQKIVDDCIKTGEIDDFSIEDISFKDIFVALKNNVVAAAATMYDLESNPFLWDFILGGINVVRKKAENKNRM